ncbi:MAG: PD-(D/E)XK nuclease domain-containing protein, partial [Bacteroidales bacterium]|nr:PD-(D/E)XK nuclease domain-containing protein [Bacteroidales bacterium]
QGIQLQHLKIPVQEWLYRTSILAFLRGCGIVVEAELHTFKGRPDLVISYRGSTFIIEIKVAFKTEDVSAKLTEAETQIREKEYIKPYPDAICLAMVIDDTQRQIVKCEKVE